MAPGQVSQLFKSDEQDRVEEDRIIEQALEILQSRLVEKEYAIHGTEDLYKYLRLRLTPLEHEVFFVIFLDVRNRIIAMQEMFRGTIDGASVHPREVVKEALSLNAGAAIFAHNHPSGVAEPSRSDEAITQKLSGALKLVGVDVLDHVIIGDSTQVSFAERGMI
ncbi:RadC family protein [Thioalkalivibrio thiocyanodenitrificans]|nr:DNA repair protein RadC [Thioalkalivibrio thiocyanodenitrificans]